MTNRSIDQPAGRKDDSGKERFDLIPHKPLFELARVYTIGASKYEGWNWAKGIAYSRIFAAMMRHSWKWMRGEAADPENGQLHLASVAWCAFTLMHFDAYPEQYKKFDDRYKI